MREKKINKHVAPAPRRKKQQGGGLSIILVTLLALAAVVTGLSLPGLFSAIQSRSVEKLKRQEELGTATLMLSNDERMLEKLRLVCFEEGTEQYETVELQNGRFLSPEEAERGIEDIFILTANTGLYTGGALNWHITECEPFLLIPRSGNMSTALLWRLEAQMDSGRDEYILQLLLDDETGLILAASFEGSAGGNINHAQALRILSENMQAYYGFQNTQLLPPAEEEMEINKYNYSIHCFEDSERVFDIPVGMSPFGWQIGGSGGVYGVEEEENSH